MAQGKYSTKMNALTFPVSFIFKAQLKWYLL